MKNTALALVSILIGVIAAPDIQAETISTTIKNGMSVNGSGACQSALPVYDVNVRKRPRAVQNEGAGPAFVTCAIYTTWPHDEKKLIVYLVNNAAQPAEVACTAVNGYDMAPTLFITKVLALPTTGQVKMLEFVPGDFQEGAETFPWGELGVSCQLVPGVGIARVRVIYDEVIDTYTQ